MLREIEHRGPDAEGVFTSDQISLGNRRLSIIGLDDGNQPIYNESGDVVVVYNGEIYDFPELRANLQAKGHRFRTHTDTEVLVHLYEEFGDDLASHLNGMFAFALWDGRRRRLLLARDQVGIKPLCYWWDGRTLVFGSEIKSILQHPEVTAERDAESTHLLLNLRFVPGPRTLFKNIYKLPPGHRMIFENGRLRVERYWQWDTTPDDSLDMAQCAQEFDTRLQDAVGRQLVADVPVGAFLSGGLDSSAIVASVAALGGPPLKTFSLGFGEPTDELGDAAIVARAFHTEHTEAVLSPNPLAEFPRVIRHVEEPKVNAIQGYWVSRLAAQHVKVALSGLGGDELYAGYDIYRYLRTVDRLRAVCPSWLSRQTAAWALKAGRWGDQVFGLAFENFRRGVELAANLNQPAMCYSVLRNGWDFRQAALRKVYCGEMRRGLRIRTLDVLSPYFTKQPTAAAGAGWAEWNLKMVDDFLHNEDRVSMANSLEVRVPFLDRQLVQHVLKIPPSMRFHAGNKAIMKRALQGRLPGPLQRKRKQGFTFNPYLQFKKDLRSVAHNVLTPDNVKRQGIFNPRFLNAVMNHRPSPQLRWHYFMLWMAIGLHYWDEIFLERKECGELAERASAVVG